MEDAIQLLTGHMALAGLVLTLVGCGFGWPRRLRSQRAERSVFSFGQAQTLLGLVVAFVGLVLLVIGLATHPVY
jgi:hypothetical protein